MASSSSEEKDKESASESESSDEQTDQTNVSDSDSETESEVCEESDSVSEPEPEHAAKKKSTLPEGSTVKSKPSDDDKAKRNMAENEEVPAKKRTLFQRALFSEADDITLLQGILDFTSTRDWELNEYYAYVKNLCTFDFTIEQLESRIQRLRKWFVKKEEAVLSRDIDDKKRFELSIKIWGDKGVFPTKNRGTKRDVDAAVDTSHPAGLITSLFKQENVVAFGLDESTLMSGWDMVKDGPKKREMEAKAKKLLEMEKQLRVKSIGLVNNAAKLIFKD